MHFAKPLLHGCHNGKEFKTRGLGQRPNRFGYKSDTKNAEYNLSESSVYGILTIHEYEYIENLL